MFLDQRNLTIVSIANPVPFFRVVQKDNETVTIGKQNL